MELKFVFLYSKNKKRIIMKQLKVVAVIFSSIILISATGCSAISKLIKSDPIKEMLLATPVGTLERMEATEVNQSTPVPQSEQLLLSDDFSDPDSGWSILSDDLGSTDYVNGTYQVIAIKESNYNWGVAGQTYNDVRVDVDVDVIETNPSLDDGFGVDCRIQENGDGYGFRIASDGYIAIELFSNDETTELVEWEFNDAVYTDGRTNHLTAICNGSQFSFFVNDIKVATTNDSTFSTGDLALSAYSGEADAITVTFDNLEVHSVVGAAVEPPQGEYSLEVNNPTDFEICGMFIVPSSEDYWKDNLLVDGDNIAPGENKTFSNLSDPSVDLRAETCDFFTVSEGYEIDLSTTTSYTLEAPRLLLHQPFDNTEGWPSGVVDGGMVSSNNGMYSLVVSEAEKLVTATGKFSGQDLVLFANASLVKAGGGDMGIYGITCRMRPDGSGIFFAIRGDGMASIIAINKGEMEQLTDWSSSEYIHAGLDSNNIEADCLGSDYTMFVNGDYVGTVEDTRYQNGKVGVAVFSPAGESTEADFDFLDVYAGE
ncbi:MAG: hypothetical protein C0410_12530 [Anaerolinea sp.]|nr:hypothetical protein [Anaerolinea sp.]